MNLMKIAATTNVNIKKRCVFRKPLEKQNNNYLLTSGGGRKNKGYV